MANEQHSQPLQAVRLLGTTELKYIQIHTNQGRAPIVLWSDIEKQFPGIALAIFAGDGLDFERDYNKQQYVYRFQNYKVLSEPYPSMPTTRIN